jgi:hypothetical protein
LVNMQAWESDEVDNSVPEQPTPPMGEGEEYYSLNFGFEWSEDPDIIWQQLRQYMEAYCTWGTIAEHACDHDEDETPCGWDRVDSWGTLPANISEYERSP